MTTAKPLVYVAGPYTNPDPVVNTNRAVKEGLRLYETGKCAVLIPHVTLLAHAIEPRGVDYWYEFDLDQMAHCHAVWRMSGASTGADAEVAQAVDNGVPVFTEDAGEWDALVDWCEGWAA